MTVPRSDLERALVYLSDQDPDRAGERNGSEQVLLDLLPETFSAQIEIVDAGYPGGPCWRWLGRIDVNGYGRYRPADKDPRFKDQRRPAHRWGYERINGPIEEGKEPDHLCRHRWCAKFLHVEPVTHQENILRGTSPMARQAQQAECLRGHPFDEDNTHRDAKGRRDCRACGALLARNRRRALGIGPRPAKYSKPTCVHGHPYTEDNTRLDKHGARFCRACEKARTEARAQSRKAAA